VTAAEYARLRPGDVIRALRGSRRLRVVVHAGARVLSLRKVGRSWTDPHPVATYTVYDILADYEVTGARARLTPAERAHLRAFLRFWRLFHPGPCRPGWCRRDHARGVARRRGAVRV
jgi:hypothetical protein